MAQYKIYFILIILNSNIRIFNNKMKNKDQGYLKSFYCSLLNSPYFDFASRAKNTV